MFYLRILEFDDTVMAARVAIMPDCPGAALQELDAETWIDARDLVDVERLRHVPGFGWFLKSSISAPSRDG